MSTIENKDGIEITILNKQIKTIEEFVEAANIDLEEWVVKKCIANKWDVTMKINDVPVLRENWQTKLILEKKLNIQDITAFKQSILEDIKSFSTYVPKVKQSIWPDSGNLVEMHIPDLHLGKISAAELHNNKKWCTLTAYKDFQKVIDYYISILKAHSFQITMGTRPDKILLVLGNDMFNTNISTPFPQTVKGTPQSEDNLPELIFRFGKYMVVEAIHKLYSVIPNIEILMIPGNHDETKVFYLGEILEALFFNNENIKVDNSLSSRKYFRWGINLLGFAHGNQKNEGIKRLSYLMQEEAAKDWSKSKIREWHLGDIHHNKKVQIIPEEDIQGINIRFFRTLMIGDPWEHKQGYVSRKGADMLIWNKTKGKVLEVPCNQL